MFFLLYKGFPVFALIVSLSMHAQVVILDPDGNGGFENGGSFSANGWTVSNGSEPNQWVVGNQPGGLTGTRCAYISDDGSSYRYNINGATEIHFYRSIDRTPYTNTVILEFDWRGEGESGWDALTVGFTGSASCCSAGSGILNPKTILLDQVGGQNSWTTESFDITGVNTGHDKLDFYWESGSTSGTQPPHAIDNVYMYEVSDAPIEMEYFEASLMDQSPVLQWETSKEENFSHFDIQRSVDNIRYTTIGRIYADEKPASGKYRFTDENPWPNNYLYRLKEVDKDGTISFSKTVSVKIDPKSEKIERLFPNPVKTKTRLVFVAMQPRTDQVFLLDAMGRLVKQIPVTLRQGTNIIVLDLNDVQSGIYQLRIGHNVQKIVKE